MREILFRGKRTKNNEWVYGWLGHIQSYDQHTKKISSVYFTEIDDDLYSRLNTIVDYQTVGQYTGLTDKNGNKIFEGDIVLYARDEEIGQIAYHENEAMFVVEFDTWLTDFDHLYGKDLEIIGNIHDNPELLKGGAE